MSFINLSAYAPTLAALASATSANGTARNGATLVLNQVTPGTLSARCTATIVTGSVVATFKWQVSQDASTWYDLKDQNNTASTTIAATGSIVLSCPLSAAGWKYARVVGTLSGAATAAGDLTEATMYWLRFGDIET